MKLHIFPPSPNSKKVLFAAAHIGAKAEIAVCDLQAGAQYSPEMLALNPNGKMPVLENDDGSSLWESNVIINKMAGEAKSDLWPVNDGRYEILRWQFWEACHWTPACSKYLSRHLFDNADVDMEAAEKDFRKFAAVLNTALDGSDWLVGDAITTADISLSMILSYADTCHIPLADFPNIARWMRRIETLPAWTAAHPEKQAA